MLIDEFQDTSVLQYKILEPLINEIMSGSANEYKTFFYVGDIKQSIYRFRGGTKELFDWVIKNYSPLLKLEVLKTNYRSSTNVVSFVNDVFSNIQNYEYHPQLINSQTKGYVEITSLYTHEEEKFIDIKNKLLDLFENGVNPKNIAILTYTNKDVLELYEYLSKQFTHLKIITEVTSKLINQNNIKACINLVKYYYFNESIYMGNFNSLIGNQIDKKIELLIDLKRNTLHEVLNQIAYYYELFDENFLKFIESLDNYKDIVDFIYEIDNLDTSMVNKQNNGLQLLTVFKSKGLEFDTVLVLDRITRKNSDKSALLFEYDDIYLNNIYYKNKLRESFDNEYLNAIDNERNLSLNDERNILYVALTRAKSNMIIFKKAEKSVFDILNNNLANRKIGSIHLSDNKMRSTSTETKIKYNAINIGIQEVKSNKNTDKNTNIKAKYFGLAAHYCLEMMKKFDVNSLDFSIKLVKSKYNSYLLSDDFNNIYKRVLLLINDKEFKSLLENSLYTKEQALVYKEEIKIIDLLIQKKDSYVIVDYKTSNNKDDSHVKQVNLYKKAIKDISKTDNVTAYLVYLKDKNIEIIKV